MSSPPGLMQLFLLVFSALILLCLLLFYSRNTYSTYLCNIFSIIFKNNS